MVDGQVEPEVKNLDESIDNATKKEIQHRKYKYR